MESIVDFSGVDFISGIFVFICCWMFFFWANDIKTLRTFMKLKSTNKVILIIGANLLWLLLIPATFYYYSFRFDRGDCANNIGDTIIIPIAEFTMLILTLWVPMNVFLQITLTKAKLPTKLFLPLKKYNFWTMLVEFSFYLLLILNCVILIYFVVDGNHFAIPTNLYFTYVLVVIRSGLIARISDTGPSFSNVA